MATPIAVQLYSLRAELAADFSGTVRRLAEIGFAGVETAGIYGESPAAAAALFRELGLAVPSAHLPLPIGEQRAPTLEAAEALGCATIVCAYAPPERFAGADQIRALCDELNQGAEAAAAAGLRLAYHNHWWELAPIDGRPALLAMLDWLDPAVLIELDAYWARTAGHDPAALLRQLGPRAPLLHLKDGPCTTEDPMVALGTGAMDLPAVLAAAQADWLIVELDRCATDMLEAIAASHRYLKSQAGR